MRAIEHAIVERTRDEPRSVIRLHNFYGIEIKGFAAEIARLALLIAEFQADCRYIGQQEARSMVLPLHRTGQIHTGNALRLDWLTVCPPATKAVVEEHDLAGPTGRLALEDNGLEDAAEPETYICGNPPYLGKGKKEERHQEDLEHVFGNRLRQWGYVDYVGAVLLLASDYVRSITAQSALVTTNSICQGRQLPQIWPLILAGGVAISFAQLSFKWRNNAANSAGVTCVIVGLCGQRSKRIPTLFQGDHARSVRRINAYLLEGDDIYVRSETRVMNGQLPALITGSVPNDGGNLILSGQERAALLEQSPNATTLLKRFIGSEDFIQGNERYCLSIPDSKLSLAKTIPAVAARLKKVQAVRLASPKKEAREELARVPHRFQHVAGEPQSAIIIVPSVSSASRAWFPVGYVDASAIVSNLAFIMLDPPLWSFSVAASRIHLVWIATVCGKLKTDVRYSNTLGWNTFSVPPLTAQNRADLTRCAENILLAREAHFPATIAELYETDNMPEDLRQAHEANDDTLERIYIGRRFRNDTERLEKLFDLYMKMTASQPPPKKPRRAA